MIYFVAHQNVDFINKDIDAICAKVEAEFACKSSIYRERVFCNSTRLAHLVCDEIGLVLRSNRSDLSVCEFSSKWGLLDHLERPIFDLSGGWQKHLNQSLFIEISHHSVALIMQGFSQYLDDALIERSLSLIEKQRCSSPTLLVEWDARPILPYAAKMGLIRVEGEEIGGLNQNITDADVENGGFIEERIICISG